MRKQGNPVGEYTRARCIQLLSTTDLTMVAIAKRLDTSPALVKTINDELRIREYNGKHMSFTRAGEVVSGA